MIWLDADPTVPKLFQGIEKATSEQFDYWRLNQGLPIGSGELDGQWNPLELGLATWVSLAKGCYLGQETMAKLARTGGTKQQLRFWQANCIVSVGQALVSSAPELLDSKRAGLITSAIEDSTLGSSFGLALVKSRYLKEQELLLSGSLDPVTLSIPLTFISPPRGLAKN